MRSQPLHKNILCLLLWVTLPFTGVGQCPAPGQFQQELRSIQALPYDEFEELIPRLHHWCSDWKKCGYALDSNYVDALLQLSQVYLNQSFFTTNKQPLYANAVRLSQKVIALYDGHPPNLRPSDLAKAYYRLGVAYHYLFSEKKEMEALLNAVRVSDNSREGKMWMANAHLYLVYAYQAKGDYQKAMTHAERGEKLARTIRDSVAISKILEQKAQALSQLNRNGEAVEALREAISILEKDPRNVLSVASQYRLLGHLYQQNNQIEEALACLDKAFRISQRKNYIPYDFLTSIGYFYYEQGDYPQAIRYYQMALDMNPTPSSKGNILDNLGVVYWKQNKYREAFSRYQLAMAELMPSFKPTTLPQLPPAKAVRQSAEKLYLLSTIQDKADTWLDYYRRAKDASGKQKGKLLHALNTYALADSMIDYMRYEHEAEGSRLFWRQKTHRMYERALEACYLAGDAERSFHFMEKSKAVLLADKLNELGANQQLSESDMLKQSTLRKEVEYLQNQLAEVAGNDEKYTTLQKQLDEANEAFDEFRKKLEKTNPAYYRYKYDNHTPTAKEFRQILSPSWNQTGAAFVSYFVGDSAIYAFVLTSGRKQLIRLAIRPAAYRALVGEFLALCSDRGYLNAHYPRYQELAYGLYRQLWQPLQIENRQVVISPDGFFLPFEALLTSGDADDFLIRQHAISYTYSARFLQTAREQPRNEGENGFVGFAPENFAGEANLSPLRGSAEALHEVSQLFRLRKQLVREEATKANFLHYAPNASVIQLFTHAAADSTDVTEPRIYFHDAALELSELNQEDRFHAQLMVLSACETGIGANQRGEGVFSLARSFAALGVPSTVTTLWTVEDQPTYTITKSFYSYLNDGLPKDEALQRAKLDWLNEGGADRSLPSQWAGIILVGDGGPLSSSWQLTAWISGGLILLLAGSLWWYNRRPTAPVAAESRRSEVRS